MPVKCPISSILKQRKLQGKDCFEVSWEEMHGLKSSIVPAELVQSACPEKILEFQERRAQAKKTNQPRPKKKQNGISVKEVEHKLHQLLVDIEQESVIKNFGILSGGLVSEKADALIQADLADQELHLEAKLESKSGKTNDPGIGSTASSSREIEVIDLTSPSPAKNARGVSKCKEADGQCTDIIDLDELENEISPEHARKLKELRLFVASLKDD